MRVLALLVTMLLCCGFLAVLCVPGDHLQNMHTVAFMAAEVGSVQFLFCFSSVERVLNPLSIRCNFCLSSSQCLLVTVRTGHVITR